MISTLLNFRLYSQDMTRSLARIEADAAVKRDAQYYADNIGKVRSVDDLIGDYRLYTYALKAYGLSEQAGSQALMRQVLESDLSDSSSFANRLNDPRYRQLAAAFDFSSAAAEPKLQSQAQTDRLVEAYSEHVVRGGARAGEAVSALETRLSRVADVDAFLADPVLFGETARLLNLDPAITSKSYVRGILLSKETIAGASEAQNWLAQAFNFDADGKLASGTSALSPAKRAEFANRIFVRMGQGASIQAFAHQARYFESFVATVTSAQQLVNDPMGLSFIQTAFGVGNVSAETIRDSLAKRSTADHPLNTMEQTNDTQRETKTRLEALNAAFAFDENGEAAAGSAASATSLAAMTTKFYAARPQDEGALISLRTNSFRVQLSKMDSINDLLGNDPVYRKSAFEFILKAFDIDPTFESASKIRKVLQSDPSDPNSFVSRLGDERYSKLAAAFNFGADGQVRSERLVQSVREQQNVAALYARSFGSDVGTDTRDQIRKDTLAYLGAVGGIASLDELLGNKPVLDFALKAHGLDKEGLRPSDLRRLLTSDLADKDSFARSFGDQRYLDFADAFNIDPSGRIPVSRGEVQSETGFLSTQNLYLLQMMEEKAGESSEGTRLALYFLRKAGDLRTPFSVLGDRAAFEVVRTTLGLPASMAQLDIDRQAAMLKARIDFSDFQDPQKLDKFISRFATLYDLNNAPAQQSSPILALFGNAPSSAPGILGLF